MKATLSRVNLDDERFGNIHYQNSHHLYITDTILLMKQILNIH